MKPALELQAATSVATLVDVLPGSDEHSPAILLATSIRLKGGGRRTVTEKVPVPDATLLRRLTSEVSRGDEVRVTVETDWSDPDLPTRLIDFAAASAPVAHATARRG